MRMKVEFATSRFPRYYNVLGVSLIKEAIKKSSQDYYKNLYFYKDKSNKTSKNFTYSFYIKGYEIDGEDFIVKDRVVMYISTPDLELGLHIYNGLINKKTIRYKNYEIVAMTDKENEASINLLKKLGFVNEGYEERVESYIFSLYAD